VEWLGHECLISAEADGQAFVVRHSGMATNEPGSAMELTVAAGDVHLFDVETTERLT
jgi:ABC-type sugar transport system ATPase subunit